MTATIKLFLDRSIYFEILPGFNMGIKKIPFEKAFELSAKVKAFQIYIPKKQNLKLIHRYLVFIRITQLKNVKQEIFRWRILLNFLRNSSQAQL